LTACAIHGKRQFVRGRPRFSRPGGLRNWSLKTPPGPEGSNGIG